MAEFGNALGNILRNEGGYVNDPDDPGGETYYGISREHFPRWAGWARVDAHKVDHSDPTGERWIEDTDLFEQVTEFYRSQFWDVIKGNKIRSTAVAEELFDTAVHVGVTRAIRYVQRALNLLSGAEEPADRLEEDGIVGPETLGATNGAIKAGDIPTLLTMMNVMQGAYYLDLLERNPTLCKYARGWMARVET